MFDMGRYDVIILKGDHRAKMEASLVGRLAPVCVPPLFRAQRGSKSSVPPSQARFINAFFNIRNVPILHLGSKQLFWRAVYSEFDARSGL